MLCKNKKLKNIHQNYKCVFYNFDYDEWPCLSIRGNPNETNFKKFLADRLNFIVKHLSNEEYNEINFKTYQKKFVNILETVL